VVNSTGLYTAPAVTTQSTCGVRATSTVDQTKYGRATVTVNPPAQHTVELTWDESSTNVISFNVYRGLSSGGPYTLIQSGVAATLYTDATVGSGAQYFYVVAALDNLGKESPYSNETTAIVP
jgi:fibronectin type 3 domain-containing protein